MNINRRFFVTKRTTPCDIENTTTKKNDGETASSFGGAEEFFVFGRLCVGHKSDESNKFDERKD